MYRFNFSYEGLEALNSKVFLYFRFDSPKNVNPRFSLLLKLAFTDGSYFHRIEAQNASAPQFENTRFRAMVTALKSDASQARMERIAEVRPVYLEALTLVERLHRRLLDVIKDEFDRRGRGDVNSVQALLLYNIGDKELTAGELRTRGYYLGSNVSYNVKKLVETGYLHHARSRIDRRAVRISLTDKGREVHEVVAGLYDKHVVTVEQIGGITSDEFARLNQSLVRLERFWTDQIRFRL
jgi:DNA-binding MarR family transcriptional regulator